MRQQIDTMLPDQLREPAIAVLEKCKDVGQGYKNHCDKSFYTSICMYKANPDIFLYP